MVIKHVDLFNKRFPARFEDNDVSKPTVQNYHLWEGKNVSIIGQNFKITF